jgi:uncharacterized protein
MRKSRGKIRSSMSELLDMIGAFIDGIKRESLTVSVMGQTGVGKSSLINSLFGTDLPTDPVRPGTTQIMKHEVQGKFGHKVVFYDLPGLGESSQGDRVWIPQYQQHLRESDIVIWAVLADSRSFKYDLTTLATVINGLNQEQQVYFLSRIVFVLTKTDLLTDPQTPVHWSLVKQGVDESFFLPDKNLSNLIQRKEDYFREVFIDPFKPLIKARTYHKGPFNVKIPGMRYEEGIISYDGFVEQANHEAWKSEYPEYKAAFRRLYESCRIIPCSARFKYNLDLLMNVIIGKLDIRSAGRFGGFVELKPMGRISYSQAKEYVNIILVEDLEKAKEEN